MTKERIKISIILILLMKEENMQVNDILERLLRLDEDAELMFSPDIKLCQEI